MALKADPTTAQVAKKAAVIDEIKTKLQGAEAAVLTEYRGLTVSEIADLRAALRPAATEYKVYKNTLVQRAANEAGMGDALAEMLTGPVAIAFINGDAAAAAKALRDFAKVNQNLIVKGGLLGERPIGASDLDALAELPSREVMLSQIAGLFEAPMSQTAGLLAALLRDTVGLVQALIDQGGAPGAPADVPVADAPEAAVEVVDSPAEPESAPEVVAESETPETEAPEAETPEAETPGAE
jgi:large subunit ribosomal protein L10